MANVLSAAQRVQIVTALVEGNSLRATARMAGVSRITVGKLLSDLGSVCATLQAEKLVNLNSKRVQVDEIWSFVGMKNDKAIEQGLNGQGQGDVWTFVALDADTKLAISWLVGNRDYAAASDFLTDVSARLSSRVQLTSDGAHVYLNAVDEAFGGEVDFAMLHKMYGADVANDRRYSPAKCIGAEKRTVIGKPDSDHVSTSFVERSNLTMRMSIRRFTRLTNAFSKKLEQHICAVALHFAYYNFCRAHMTLRTKGNNRVTPAMASGVETRQWSVADLVALLPEVEHNGGRPKNSSK